MKLFKVTNNTLKEVGRTNFKLEKDIQSLIEKNLKDVFNLEFIATEFEVKLGAEKFRIDTLGYNKETKSFVIIEYKKVKDYSVVDQGYTYLSALINNKSDFVLKYINKTKTNLEPKDFDWSQSRVIFISPSFSSYQKNSVNFRDVPFELWQIQKYEDGHISLEQHIANSDQSIDGFKQDNKIIDRLKGEIVVTSETDLTSKTNEIASDAWAALKSHYLENADIELNVRKTYISFKKMNTAICYVKFQKTNLKIEILRGYETKANGSKKVLKISDPQKKCTEVVNTYANGDREIMCRFTVSSVKDVEYAKFLIDQKLNAI
jgi:predicted transport protein